MSDNRSYIEDPNEKYEFLVRPLDGSEARVWQECTRSDYYGFGQVVPVRITIPNKEGGDRLEIATEGHYPILASGQLNFLTKRKLKRRINVRATSL